MGKIIQKCFPLLMLISASAAAQNSQLHTFQQQLGQLEARVNQARGRRQALAHSVDSLAAIIQKQKKNPSFFSQRALAENLQRSSEYASFFQRAQENEAVLLDSLLRVADRILAYLNSAIPEMAKQRQVARQQKNKQAEKLLKSNLRIANDLRKRCQAILTTLPPTLVLLNIQIRPDDPPEVVRKKAGFILDQADRLRKLAQQARGKIADLESEITMRDRLRDFVQDLRLFDPTAEAVATTGGGNKTLGVENTGTQPPDFRAVQDKGSLPENTILTIIPAWPGNIGKLSQADLHAWIQKLKADVKNWQAQADSLDQHAREVQSSLNKQE